MYKSINYTLCTVILLICLTNTWAKERTWTNTQGQTIAAQLIDITHDKIEIKKADGKQFFYAIADLSEADHQYLNKVNQLMANIKEDIDKDFTISTPPMVVKGNQGKHLILILSQVDPINIAQSTDPFSPVPTSKQSKATIKDGGSGIFLTVYSQQYLDSFDNTLKQQSKAQSYHCKTIKLNEEGITWGPDKDKFAISYTSTTDESIYFSDVIVINNVNSKITIETVPSEHWQKLYDKEFSKYIGMSSEIGSTTVKSIKWIDSENLKYTKKVILKYMDDGKKKSKNESITYVIKDL